MPKIFESMRMTAPRYSAFDMSRMQKTSFNMGELTPTLFEEILPGDHFKASTEIMLRFAPMLAPVMHRVNVFMHYFFVPHRIVYNEWEDFITGGKDGNAAPIFPTFPLAAQVRDSRLADYLGIPNYTATSSTKRISQLPFRGYQLIWNEFFRDETLDNPIDIHTATIDELVTLRTRCWEKDYFTSSLPFTQRGAQVGIPIDLEYKDISDVRLNTGGVPAQNTLFSNAIGEFGNTAGDRLRLENLENLSLDFSINELRESSALQRWLEKAATGGYRYVEQLLSRFGVRSSDARLQRPEYLGGGRQPLVISEVLNTTGTTEAPQGDMTGHGISVGRTNSFEKHFEEHGYLFGIMSVLPRTAYQQGIHKTWLRDDKFEFYQPELANLGEQAVQNIELYFNDSDDTYNDATFGYQQRYAEYKHAQSSVHGDFRTTLDFWTLSRIFSTPPSLNSDFVNADPSNRIFAVTTEDTLWCQLFHKVHARRKMPYFAKPSLR